MTRIPLDPSKFDDDAKEVVALDLLLSEYNMDYIDLLQYVVGKWHRATATEEQRKSISGMLVRNTLSSVSRLQVLLVNALFNARG